MKATRFLGCFDPGLKALCLPLLLSVGACVHIFHEEVELQRFSRTSPPATQRVTSPVRAHLSDLSMVFYRRGVTATADSLIGEGEWYGPSMELLGPHNRLPLDSVIGFEALAGGRVEPFSTIVVSAIATAGTAFASILLFKALFGSCPTIYSSDGDGFRLEAEGFSYSISPLAEARDVDVLRGAALHDGAVELEVRNEALETHFINQLELLAVDTRPGEDALPDTGGRPLAFRPAAAVISAIDRMGRDVTDVLAHGDGQAFATDSALIREAAHGDPFDQIFLELPPLSGVDEVGLVLRLRNSLLTTLLFYDVMLAPAGLEAVDWLAKGTASIGPALEIASWIREYLGLRIEVEEGSGEFRTVARLSDVGPIAWEEVVVPVPVHAEAATRIRLSFLADSWRIDRVGLAADLREPRVTAVPVHSVVGSDQVLAPDARLALSGADDRYLETRPGHRFTVRFVPPVTAERPSTFLLASQGYYTEWIRRDWVRQVTEPRIFRPSRATVTELLTRWSKEKEPLQEAFYSTRIPVR